MSTTIDPSRIFTRQQVDELLTAAIGKTLLQVDKARLFAHHEGRDKVKGIAGDIIEESVLGCKKDSKQEPDILVDGVLTELKTTGMIEPKKKDSPYVYECKEPVSVTAVSIPVIVNEEFETSNFWHKLAHMLWVYYWYKSPVTVKLMRTSATDSQHSPREILPRYTSHNHYFLCDRTFAFLNHRQSNESRTGNRYIAKDCIHAHGWHRSSNPIASAPS